jgi:hypothetical protein
MLNLSDREKVILGLYYRSIGFCRSAIELKSVVHQQSLTSTERSVIELYVDMELVHRNAIPDAVAKVVAFGDWQMLSPSRSRQLICRRLQGLLHEPPRHPQRQTRCGRIPVDSAQQAPLQVAASK